MNKSTTIYEIRLANLRHLIEESPAIEGEIPAKAGSIKSVALQSGAARTHLSQILSRYKTSSGKPREVGSDLARQLEKGCGKSIGWMDVKHDNLDPAEDELRNLFAAMDEEMKATTLQMLRVMSKNK